MSYSEEISRCTLLKLQLKSPGLLLFTQVTPAWNLFAHCPEMVASDTQRPIVTLSPFSSLDMVLAK